MAEDAPSLLELARERRQSKKITRCTIGRLLVDRPEMAEQINDLITNSGDDRDVTYSVAAEILTEATGTKMDGQTVSRHRRRSCACP